MIVTGAGLLERDHVRGHPPDDGVKIPPEELAAALEEAYSRVDEAVFGRRTFATEDEAAWYLHDRLYDLSVDYGIEFGARIYRLRRGGPWHVTAPESQGVSNRVWIGEPPKRAFGSAGAWHSHASGAPPNHYDFTNAFSPGRRCARSFVSHMHEGRPVLSGVGPSSKSFRRLDR